MGNGRCTWAIGLSVCRIARCTGVDQNHRVVTCFYQCRESVFRSFSTLFGMTNAGVDYVIGRGQLTMQQ